MLFPDAVGPPIGNTASGVGRKSILNLKAVQSQPQIRFDRSQILNFQNKADNSTDTNTSVSSSLDFQITSPEISKNNESNDTIDQKNSPNTSKSSILELTTENIVIFHQQNTSQNESFNSNNSSTVIKEENSNNTSFQSSQSMISNAPSPIANFENSFNKSLNKALSDFKYTVSRNIVLSIRSEAMDISSYVDETIENLNTLIPDAIRNECIYQNPISNLNTDVFYNCNEQILQIEQQLADYKSANEVQKTKSRKALEKVGKSIEACRQIFTDIAQQSQEICESFLQSCRSQNDIQKSKIKSLHRMLRSYKLRNTEIITKIENQMMELDSIEKSIEKTERFRQQPVSQPSTPRISYTKKISNEMHAIFDVLKELNEGNFKTDLAEVKTSLVYLTKQAVQEINNLAKETPVIKNPYPQDPPSVMKVPDLSPQKTSISPEKIRRDNRRLHEETQSRLEENRRILYENDPIGYTLDNL